MSTPHNHFPTLCTQARMHEQLDTTPVRTCRSCIASQASHSFLPRVPDPKRSVRPTIDRIRRVRVNTACLPLQLRTCILCPGVLPLHAADFNVQPAPHHAAAVHTLRMQKTHTIQKLVRHTCYDDQIRNQYQKHSTTCDQSAISDLLLQTKPHPPFLARLRLSAFPPIRVQCPVGHAAPGITASQGSPCTSPPFLQCCYQHAHGLIQLWKLL